ncbi:MAG: glycoside hydrolase, partial [Elusimicrobiota bacterium]
MAEDDPDDSLDQDPEPEEPGIPDAPVPESDLRDKHRRYVVIHGHFYQPPRENPWIEVIEKEPSAHPRHDWNERVAWECYIPNKAARVVSPDGKILDVVNNYAWFNFNFGPTLLDWFEKTCPHDSMALIEADRESRERLGHGNAIAQAYNHIILPLANPRDRATQVRWGIADFRFRFGRDPEAMWVPETAVNADTLRTLIDHGMRYVILSPTQAEKIRRLGRGGRWHFVWEGSIDTRRAYRWFDKDPRGHPDRDRFIDVFFYD